MNIKDFCRKFQFCFYFHLSYLPFVLQYRPSQVQITRRNIQYPQIIFILFLLLQTDFKRENIGSHSQIFYKISYKVARLKAWKFIKKRLQQVFSYKFRAIFQKALFTEHLQITAPTDSSVPTKVLSTDHILFVFPSFFSFHYW